jgi:hypothetical protein
VHSFILLYLLRISHRHAIALYETRLSPCVVVLFEVVNGLERLARPG